MGYDRKRQLIYIIKNGKQNTEPSFDQIRQLVWFLEAASVLAPKGTELWTLLIDMKVYNDDPAILPNYIHPPLSLTKQVINLIQDHYPERLNKALILNVPLSIWTFLKLIHPLIDSKTRHKIYYDEPLDEHIESDQLDKEHKGKLDFNYKHDIYWPDLDETILSRRNKQFSIFTEMGKSIGMSEFDLK